MIEEVKTLMDEEGDERVKFLLNEIYQFLILKGSAYTDREFSN